MAGTELDKQAEDFCYPKVEAWFSDGGDFRPTAEMCSEIAAAFASQVREQSIAECAEIVERTPLGYVTERDHEVLEKFADLAIASIRVQALVIGEGK